MPLSLDDIIKSFGNPALGLVRHDDDGKTGVSGALLDALGDDPYLALQLRQKGHRAPLPGVVDCPASRLILDRICDDDDAMQQAAALLSGEVNGVTFTAPVLIHLLRYIPALPLASIAAIEAPADLARRPFVMAWINQQVAAGHLPTATLHGMEQVDLRDYADIAHDDSPLADA